MTSPSYKNVLLDNDICFKYPLDLKLQSPLVNSPTSPTIIEDKAIGGRSSTEKFIDERYAKIKVPDSPSKPAVNSNKPYHKDHPLDPISLLNQIKDQIETLKNEICFLREELREKNLLIKHLVGYESTTSVKVTLKMKYLMKIRVLRC